jgi:hypothetical protein
MFPAAYPVDLFFFIQYSSIKKMKKINRHQNNFFHQDAAAAIMYVTRVAGEGLRSSACSSKLRVDVDMLHFGQLTRLLCTS